MAENESELIIIMIFTSDFSSAGDSGGLCGRIPQGGREGNARARTPGFVRFNLLLPDDDSSVWWLRDAASFFFFARIGWSFTFRRAGF